MDSIFRRHRWARSNVRSHLCWLSGLSFTEVELYTTTETPIGREAYELRPTGWGGMAPPETGITVQKKCPYCGHTVYNGMTNPHKLSEVQDWDGSDFFIIWPMPKFIMVTSRVRRFLLERGYSGIKTTPLGELRTRDSPGSSTFTPGPLADWFDKKKVAEIRQKAMKHNGRSLFL